MDEQEIRVAAGVMASAVNRDHDDPHRLIAYADRLVPWIAGTATTRLVLTAAVIDGIAVTVNQPGGTMAQTVAATVDNTTVTLVASPQDDHNDPTPDLLTWTNDDTASAVAAWVLSADTDTYTGTLTHAEGTVNITITDPTAPALSPTVVTLTVGPGATSQINVTATVV
jgi:hypothetical protein